MFPFVFRGSMKRYLLPLAVLLVIGVMAAGILAPIGFVLSPAVGALFMSVSTVIVAANAQPLRRVSLSR
jgi:cation transport ATPase